MANWDLLRGYKSSVFPRVEKEPDNSSCLKYVLRCASIIENSCKRQIFPPISEEEKYKKAIEEDGRNVADYCGQLHSKMEIRMLPEEWVKDRDRSKPSIVSPMASSYQEHLEARSRAQNLSFLFDKYVSLQKKCENIPVERIALLKKTRKIQLARPSLPSQEYTTLRQMTPYIYSVPQKAKPTAKSALLGRLNSSKKKEAKKGQSKENKQKKKKAKDSNRPPTKSESETTAEMTRRSSRGAAVDLLIEENERPFDESKEELEVEDIRQLVQDPDYRRTYSEETRFSKAIHDSGAP
eukprot:Nk52_evm81s745 gene=Nk52_evmTU81s745